MPIVRWKPFGVFTSLERDMQSMVAHFFEWRPAVDMVRDDGELVITAEVPGIKVEDLDIEIEDNVLHIKGKRSYEKKIDEEDRYLSERFFGSFSRDLLLPEGIDAEELEASFRDGVITIRLEVPEEVLPKPHKVDVKLIAD